MTTTKRARRFLFALAGVLGVAATALAVDVKGSVRSSEEPKHEPPKSARAPYFQEWNGFIEPKKRSVEYAREVACVLIGEAPSASKDATQALLQDGTLTPSTIVMQAGTTLRVRNEDDFTHQLYAEGLKAFDPIETSSGASRQVQIDQAGSFPIGDRLAPHVQGHLHVLPKVSYVVYPSNDGTFAFPDVAPGHYMLKVFRGATEVSSTEVDLPDERQFQIDPISVDLKPRK